MRTGLPVESNINQNESHDIDFIRRDDNLEQDTDIQNVINNYKIVFEGMGKLMNFQLKLHIDEQVTLVQQSVRILPYYTRKMSRKN